MLLDSVSLFPLILIVIVFFNRYFFGLLVSKLRSWREGVTTPASPPTASQCPTVTIILPLYNEGSSIYSTLCSLVELRYPSEQLQILVVDDCSSDDSHSWALRAAALYPNIQVLRNPINQGKRLSITHAVGQTTSDFIVSVDSDVVVHPDALTHLLAGFTNPNIAAVGGRVHASNCHTNWLTRMQTIKYFLGYQYLKNLENAFRSVMCLSGCLTAYRRTVLLELEPILLRRTWLTVPIKYGEDRFLTRQIIKHGYQTKLVAAAECYTKVPATLSAYFAQQLRWRRSNIIDFIGGLSHIWNLNLFVAVHYVSLQCMILAYPVYLWGVFLSGSFFEGAIFHCGILGIYAWIYHLQASSLPKCYRVHPIYILPLGAMLPLTYMVFSILALLTLDSGSWETRQSTTTPQPLGPTV